MQRLGELAAFGTSVSWTIGALVMEKSVNRVGVMAVNTMKVAFACVYLAVFAYFVNGQFFPLDVGGSAWAFIAASAFFGFVIGDYFLFHAYALIGSRLSMLLMSVSVPLTAIAAYFIFGEAMGAWALAGMALCVAGIALTVISGKSGAEDSGAGDQTACAASDAGRSRAGRYAKGVAFGLLSGVCMAAATLCTKRGAAGVDSVSATQIRILCAFIGFVAFAVLTRKTGEIRAAIVNPRALVLLAIGGIFGPFIGVGLLLYAIQHADAGIVSTLSSFPPVLIIPPSILLFGKRVRPGEIAGAVVAVAGLALLFA
ncbi:MAG TPA: DMT family transporter [Treponemataceae bacterium]|nr:DMT family transporter [Treponemataceae bacterium]